jgi:peroxiredoxin
MKEGEPFPKFAMTDENGEPFSSAMLGGFRFILFLYGSDADKGGLSLISQFGDITMKLMIRNVPAIGAGSDGPESHRMTIDKLGVGLKLLSDKNGELAGKVGEGSPFSVFIIGKDGRTEAIWHFETVDNVAAQVYDRVKSMTK